MHGQEEMSNAPSEMAGHFASVCDFMAVRTMVKGVLPCALSIPLPPYFLHDLPCATMK
jgi:hypothetical protein